MAYIDVLSKEMERLINENRQAFNEALQRFRDDPSLQEATFIDSRRKRWTIRLAGTRSLRSKA